MLITVYQSWLQTGTHMGNDKTRSSKLQRDQVLHREDSTFHPLGDRTSTSDELLLNFILICK